MTTINLDNTQELIIAAKAIERHRKKQRVPWWKRLFFLRLRKDIKKRYRQRVEIPPPPRFEPLTLPEIEARSVRPRTTRQLVPLERHTEALEPFIGVR